MSSPASISDLLVTPLDEWCLPFEEVAALDDLETKPEISDMVRALARMHDCEVWELHVALLVHAYERLRIAGARAGARHFKERLAVRIAMNLDREPDVFTLASKSRKQARAGEPVTPGRAVNEARRRVFAAHHSCTVTNLLALRRRSPSASLANAWPSVSQIAKQAGGMHNGTVHRLCERMGLPTNDGRCSSTQCA